MGLPKRSALTFSFLLIVSAIPLLDRDSAMTVSGEGDDPIFIDGDSELTAENGISAGSGTSDDPYILEKKWIYPYYQDCIAIKNTTKYLIIRDCYARSVNGNAAISLENVGNILIDNVSVDHFSNYGIIIFGSSNIRILDSDIKGINLDRSIEVSIQNINFSGIILDSCNNINVSNSKGPEGSIMISNSSDVRINDTESQYGFYISGYAPGSILDLNDNNTVNGKPFHLFQDGDGRDYASYQGYYGQIYLINETAVNNPQKITDRLSCLMCNNITMQNDHIESKTIEIYESDQIHLVSCLFVCTVVTIASALDVDIKDINYSVEYFYRGFTFIIDNSKDIIIEDSRFSNNNGFLDLVLKNNYDITMDRTDLSTNNGTSYFELIANVRTNIEECNISVHEFDISNCLDINIEYCNFNYLDMITYKTNNATMKNNSFYSYWKIYISRSSNITVHSNYFDSLYYYESIKTRFSDNVSIFNNYFNSYISYTYEGLPAIWNDHQPNITNIVGGPNIGGNYWELYMDEDVDYDGFFDHPLPYGPYDELPLVDLRKDLTITDTTRYDPSTGRPMDLLLYCKPIYPWVTTSYELNVVTLDQSSNIIGYDNLSGPVPEDGNLSTRIDVGLDACALRIYVEVRDGYGKTASYSKYIEVMDVFAPMIELVDHSEFGTGESAWARFNVSDNIRISNLTLRMSTNVEGNISYLDHTSLDGIDIINASFRFDPSAYRAKFEMSAGDPTGHVTGYISEWIPVSDTIYPTLEILSTQNAERGDYYLLSFRTSDNIALSDIEALSIVGEKRRLLYESNERNEVYVANLKIDEFQEDAAILVRVTDSSGNSVEKMCSLYLPPIDEEHIFSLDPGYPMTGKKNTIALSVDSDEVEVCSFECSFDDGGPIYLAYPWSEVSVPMDAMLMKISISLIDKGNNEYRTERIFDVLDILPPAISIDHIQPICGNPFYLMPDYSDNIGIASHGIVFDYGNGPIEVIDDNNSPAMVGIPSDARVLNISIWANDRAGNMAYRNVSLDVLDKTLPVIERIDAKMMDGSILITAIVTDNLGNDGLVCYIKSDQLSSYPQELELTGGTYAIRFTPHPSMTNFTFTISATDASGNTVGPEEHWLEIPNSRGPDRSTGPFIWIGITLLIIISLIATVLMVLRPWRKDRSEE